MSAAVVERTEQKVLSAERTLRDKLIEHTEYIRKHGEDMPEICNWRWGQ